MVPAKNPKSLVKSKNKRCKKGERRSKKTGNCESYTNHLKKCKCARTLQARRIDIYQSNSSTAKAGTLTKSQLIRNTKGKIVSLVKHRQGRERYNNNNSELRMRNNLKKRDYSKDYEPFDDSGYHEPFDDSGYSNSYDPFVEVF